MKKIILILIALVAFGATVNAQQSYSKVDNKTFKQVKVEKNNDSTYHATGYYWETKKGDKYEIYTHTPTRGKNAGVKSCYVKRTSAKTNKEYWQKIDVKPEELSK
jgi:hypothetical protein